MPAEAALFFQFHTGLGAVLPLLFYAVSFLAVTTALFRPRIGLYALVLLLPLQTAREKLVGFPLGSHLLYLLMLTTLLGLWLAKKKLILPRILLNRLLLLIVVLSFASLVAGAFYLNVALPFSLSDKRLEMWRVFVSMFLLYVIAAGTVENKKHIATAVLLMGISVLYVNWSFLRGTMGREFTHFSYDIRDAATMELAGVNGLAAFAAEVFVFFAVFAVFQTKWKERLPILLLLMFTGYCVLFTYSRGAYLGLIGGVLVIMVAKKRFLIVPLLLLAFAWQSVLPESVIERITMTYDTNGQLEPSARQRTEIWQEAEHLIAANPVFGTGFATYYFMKTHAVENLRDTHNYYLKIAVETGLLGLLLFLVFLGNAFWNGFWLFRTAKDGFLQALGLACAAMMACVIVVNFFGDRFNYFEVNGYTWIVLGLTARGHLIIEQGQPESADPVPSLPEQASYALAVGEADE